MNRLAIITTHPIQYNAPLFKLLKERNIIECKVFYTWGDSVLKNKFDPGFGKVIEWDIPLLEGYNFEFCENVAKEAGSHHFEGINNPNLIELIKQWNPDALLIYGWSYRSHLHLMRKMKGIIPIIFRGDSTLLDKGHPVKGLIRKLFLQYVYRQTDAALYVGDANKAYFLHHGLKEWQLIFAPHTIDNDRFADLKGEYEKEAISWRVNLGIPANAVVFLFAGKFEEKKNPVLLLDVFKNLYSENGFLVFAGNGQLKEKLEDLSNGNNNIRIIDFVNQQKMPVLYRMADVFILPSKGPGETWGLSVNEAMACGKAVLVSDKCGCAKDLIYQGKNGYVFKSESKNDLKNFLEILMEKSVSDRMGAKSLEIINDYRIEKVARAIENLVENIT